MNREEFIKKGNTAKNLSEWPIVRSNGEPIFAQQMNINTIERIVRGKTVSYDEVVLSDVIDGVVTEVDTVRLDEITDVA